MNMGLRFVAVGFEAVVFGEGVGCFGGAVVGLVVAGLLPLEGVHRKKL